MRDLLLELGRGFAFVGSQVPLMVGGETFYLDLLFYHVRLHCFFVVELKVGKFKPEYAGKLNFYLSAVDGEMRSERDEPTIGLLLCESHEGAIVEYSFKDIAKPIGISSYTVTREVPSPVRNELPSIRDLEGVVARLKQNSRSLGKSKARMSELALARIPSPESLPEPQGFNRLRSAVLNGVASENSRRSYGLALDELSAFSNERQQPISRTLILAFRAALLERVLSPSTINVKLSAIRKLVDEAKRAGMIGAEEASEMSDIPNVRQNGTRLGNWLTREQAKELLAAPDRSTLKGKRDYVILALLTACALRRNELAMLDVDTTQLREGRWVLSDLCGKGRRIRTVAVPLWVKLAIQVWMEAAKIEGGRLLRRVKKGGRMQGDGLTDWAVWSVVEQAAKQIGIERFGAHDLRRTCAKLCRKAGGDLEQIKFLLGHSSIQTTERYLGSEQDIAIAVNDNIGLQ